MHPPFHAHQCTNVSVSVETLNESCAEYLLGTMKLGGNHAMHLSFSL